jgi:hypothetical protein
MIWISQLFCSKEHSIIGLSWDDTKDSRSEMEGEVALIFEKAIKNRAAHRVCQICLSTEFHVRSIKTKYATLDEAVPALRMQEVIQRMWGAMKRHPDYDEFIAKRKSH